MKKLIAILVAVAFSVVCMGQNPIGTVSAQGPPALPIFIYDINGNPFSDKSLDDVEGTPYLFKEWNWGAIRFRNGKYAKDVSLLFNVYNNKLYFSKNGQQMELIDMVKEFMIGYKDNGDSITLLFRNGYPQVDKKSTESFYEVLADGKVQLLKWRQKEINTIKPYNGATKTKFDDRQILYLFIPGSKMVKVKKDKDDIIKALPEYKSRIEEFVQKNGKLKNEDSVAQLIAHINTNL